MNKFLINDEKIWKDIGELNMYAKDLLGKKIIDKNARDLAKLSEIDINIKTFKIAKIYGSIGNPLSKKYYDIPSNAILAVGDYIQVAQTKEDLESELLEKLPESEDETLKINTIIGKSIINSEGNVAGKVVNVDIDLATYEILGLNLAGPSSGFSMDKKECVISKDEIVGIGDYILVTTDFSEEN